VNLPIKKFLGSRAGICRSGISPVTTYQELAVLWDVVVFAIYAEPREWAM
jgi:hypothetical protein